METVTTAILDKFPNLRHCKIWVVLSVAVFGYVGGLGFTTNVSKDNGHSDRQKTNKPFHNTFFVYVEWNVLASADG